MNSLASTDSERELDPILLPLAAAGGTEREQALGSLLATRAQSVISRVIAYRFRRGRIGGLREDEREDLSATATLRVLQRLRAMDDAEDGAIANFDAYVTTVTLHACDDLMRERMPRRTAARNRICYILGNDEKFAQWSAGGEMVCGLREWKGDGSVTRAIPFDAVRHLAGNRDVRQLLLTIFGASRQPVELDAVVNLAAELWQMIDRPPAALEESEHFTATTSTHGAEDREFLRILWQEIRKLNRPQRVALLLNLRDEGGPAAELFPLLGVASVKEIAETVEVDPAQFVPLWRDLPLEDLRIAAMLGVSRQQVINLRKSARERLRRRMRY